MGTAAMPSVVLIAYFSRAYAVLRNENHHLSCHTTFLRVPRCDRPFMEAFVCRLLWREIYETVRFRPRRYQWIVIDPLLLVSRSYRVSDKRSSDLKIGKQVICGLLQRFVHSPPAS